MLEQAQEEAERVRANHERLAAELKAEKAAHAASRQQLEARAAGECRAAHECHRSATRGHCPSLAFDQKWWASTRTSTRSKIGC